MDIRGLKYFICAAECMNFTKAAKECYISQTAMSQTIANLEKEIGFRLFERGKRNVKLTTAGEDFYRRIKNLVEQYEAAINYGQKLASGGAGKLKIACSGAIEGRTFMPRIQEFKRQNPSVKVSALIAPPHKILEMLLHKECDLAICWPQELVGNEQIAVQNLASFKSFIICSKNHRLAKNEKITTEELTDEKIVSLDLSRMPITYQSMCSDWKKMGLKPPTVTEFEQIYHIEDLILNISINNALAFVPETFKNYLNDQVVMIPLDMRNPVSFTVCTASLVSNDNPLTEKMLDCLQNNRIPLSY